MAEIHLHNPYVRESIGMPIDDPSVEHRDFILYRGLDPKAIFYEVARIVGPLKNNSPRTHPHKMTMSPNGCMSTRDRTKTHCCNPKPLLISIHMNKQYVSIYEEMRERKHITNETKSTLLRTTLKKTLFQTKKIVFNVIFHATIGNKISLITHRRRTFK